MYKKSITFSNLDGESVTKDFYFNLNKAEIMNLELNTKGGVENFLQKINNEKDVTKLANFIKELILLSYGEKDDDNIKFIKKRNGVRLAEDFEQTDAFSQFYMELISGENAIDRFNEFILGILPSDIRTQVQAQYAKQIEVKN